MAIIVVITFDARETITCKKTTLDKYGRTVRRTEAISGKLIMTRAEDPGMKNGEAREFSMTSRRTQHGKQGDWI